jgi:hypothetical protein
MKPISQKKSTVCKMSPEGTNNHMGMHSVYLTPVTAALFSLKMDTKIFFIKLLYLILP